MHVQGNRIIIDTNLWISFLLTKNYRKLEEILAEKDVILLFSQELSDEFLEVVQRPKFVRYFSRSDLEWLLKFIAQFSEMVVVKSDFDVCRDPKDNFLLALAHDGKAAYLLTGDKDLLD